MSDERTVTPERWLPRGEVSVSHPVDDRPLVIWGGIPGETARVHITRRGRNQVRAEWIGAQKPDPHRVAPPCDRYDACGGCPLMHVDEAGQHAAHRALVSAALAAEGLHDVALGEVYSSPDGLEDFRHVVKVGFARSEAGKLKMGAWARNTRDVVPVPKCVVSAPVLNKVMVSLAHHAIELGVEPYDPASERGVLRSAVLRASRSTGEVLITLVAARRNAKLVELAEEVARGCNEVAGIWQHLNSEPGNAIFARDETGKVGVLPILGKEFIEERLGDVTYRIGPGDFFQTNPAMAEVLYDRTLRRLEPGADDTVVDLYCGVGGLALQAGQKAGFVVGVEEVEGAVARAREVARSQRIPAEFHAGRVDELLPELNRRLAGVRPLVVVNPARRGLEDDVVKHLVELKPARIAYISCNPRAMARDLALLREQGGFEIGEIELFEMFPNTAHVECLVTLTSTETSEPRRRAPRRRRIG